MKRLKWRVSSVLGDPEIQACQVPALWYVCVLVRIPKNNVDCISNSQQRRTGLKNQKRRFGSSVPDVPA